MKTDRITPEDITLLVQICSGLLASGHFTTPTSSDPDEGPDVVKFDWGKDWKEDGCDCRFIIEATDAAFRLLDDIKTRAARENKEKEDSKPVTQMGGLNDPTREYMRDFVNPHIKQAIL